MQEKSLRKKVYPELIVLNISERMCLHNLRHYRTNGLRAFCLKHEINYNSASKIFRGSLEYPGVSTQIDTAIEKDLQEEKRSGNVSFGVENCN